MNREEKIERLRTKLRDAAPSPGHTALADAYAALGEGDRNQLWGLIERRDFEAVEEFAADNEFSPEAAVQLFAAFYARKARSGRRTIRRGDLDCIAGHVGRVGHARRRRLEGDRRDLARLGREVGKLALSRRVQRGPSATPLLANLAGRSESRPSSTRHGGARSSATASTDPGEGDESDPPSRPLRTYAELRERWDDLEPSARLRAYLYLPPGEQAKFDRAVRARVDREHAARLANYLSGDPLPASRRAVA